MRKLKILALLLLFSSFCYADYNDSVTTNQNDLIFSVNNGYDVVSINNYFYTEEIGAPQLPVKILSFVIPADKKVNSIIINSTTVQQLSGTYNIYPVQTPVPTNLAPDMQDFDAPDPQIYNSDNPYPGKLYEISVDGYPFGYHVVTIKFYPVEYIPASKILKLYTNINFTIVYENNTEDVLVPNRQSKCSYDLSKGYINSIVSNPNDLNTVMGGAREVVNNGTAASNIKGMNPTSLAYIPDYIIITNNSLKSSFQTLADWKTQKGVYTIVVSTDDIYNNYQGFDNAEKIRNYLKDVYINFGSSYILLGGDVDIVPTRVTPIYSGIYATNYYYATVDGNWNSNGNMVFGESSELTGLEMSIRFYVGRAPVHNTAEVNNFINKLIGYEKLDNTTNKNYVKNLSFWAGNDGGPSTFNNLNTIDNSTNGYINPQNYYVLKLYDNYSSHIGESQYADRYFQLNRTNVINSMNTGWVSFNKPWGNTHLIYHCDHSGFDAMGTSSITMNENISRTDMDNLTNGISYPQILYSDGCHPNEFSNDAISEHYINNQNGGGVAFIGNSDAGYWSDITNDKFFKVFCQSLYDNTKTDAYDNKYYHIGFANQYSMKTLPSYKLNMPKNRNLLGDPEMLVWTDTPQYLTVGNLNYSVTNQEVTGSVTVPVFNSGVIQVIVTVCIWKGNEIYRTQDIAVTSANTLYPFTFSGVVADTPGDITVTAIAHNYIPNISTINVSSISGAHPYMTSYTIDDDKTGGSNGNSDAQPDAGETIELLITLTNSGNATASNITATLSWTPKSYQASNMINIATSSSNFGNITAGGTGNNNSNPFVFTINKDAFENITPRLLTQFACFTLDILNGTQHIIKSFELQIAEPNMDKGENNIVGTLAAGSSNQLTIKLYNNGLAQATGLNATLSTNNPSNVTITNANSSYPDISGVNTANNSGINNSTFNFNMGSSAYSNETFNLTITNEYGKTWTFSNLDLTQPIINNISSTMGHNGYATAINLYWNIVCTTSTTIKGYNLYKSLNQVGLYTKTNNDLITYSTYLDEGLQQLTTYYYKLTVVDINGNESDYYPVNGYFASTSLNLHAGWPISPSPSSNVMGVRAEGSPNVYDVDGDNNKEIFFATGTPGQNIGGVWAFKHDGGRWFKIDGNPTNMSGFVNLQCYNTSTPALGDIENDGVTELGITTHYIGSASNSQKLLVYKTIVDNDGDNLPDKKFDVSISGWEINKGPVFSDIDNNGTSEILTNTQGSGGIRIYNSDGTNYKNWNSTTGYSFGFSMPVAFDFNNDNKKEIVIGSYSDSNVPGIYIFNEDGTNYGASNPVYTPVSGYHTDFPLVVADIDNDGIYEIIFISAQNTTANIFAIKPNGTLLNGWNSSSHPSFILSTSVEGNGSYGGQFCPTLSVGDINKDGYLEVVCGDNGHLYIWSHSGGAPMTDIPITGYTSRTEKAPIIADIDNNNSDLEIIVTKTFTSPTTGTDIYAYKINGQIVAGFPITIGEVIGNTPCIDDIDNNGKNEIIISTPAKFYVWDSDGDANNNIYGWNSYRNNNLNAGIYYNMAGGSTYDEALEYNNDIYLQNITVTTNSNNKNRYYFGKNIYAGYDVTNLKSYGPVLINNNSHVIIDAENYFFMKNDIEIQSGCILEIK